MVGFYLWLQEGMQVPVAVKTCKEDNEESMTEKFLEEACKIFIIPFLYSRKNACICWFVSSDWHSKN